VKSGVSGRISGVLCGESGFGHACAGGTVTQARQKAASGKGGASENGIGRSGGWLAGKAVATEYALGYLLGITVLPG